MGIRDIKMKIEKKIIVVCVVEKEKKNLKHNSKQSRDSSLLMLIKNGKIKKVEFHGKNLLHTTTTYHDDDMTTFTNNDCDLPF